MGCCDQGSASCCTQTVAPVWATLPCPTCRQFGAGVDAITPRHTLRGPLRSQVAPGGEYFFCATPHCGVVYYSRQGQCFHTTDLINRVTVKDASPDTPLCYCFKVLKRHALEEIARNGHCDVEALIHHKRGQKRCFCEKSNPRGTCCSSDIARWL